MRNNGQHAGAEGASANHIDLPHTWATGLSGRLWLRAQPVDATPAILIDLLTSKSNTDWAFLLELRGFGQQAAELWLEQSYADVGKKTTADMHAMLRCLESPAGGR